MTFPHSVHAILARFDHEAMPAAERWELGLKAERLAEEQGPKELLYAVRMRLVGFAHEVADAEGQLTRFLWCAATHDSDPKRFPVRPDIKNPGIDLLWWYKWLTGMLFAWPQYSLAQIRSALDMMDAAYKREGAGEAGVLWAKLQYALEVGSDEDVREALADIKVVPADDYSHCDACSRATEVSARLDIGETDTALRLFDELLQGKYTCGEEPESIASEMLMPLLRAGRAEEARALQEIAYPRIMGSPASLSLQTEHMMFFLSTGNPSTAYTLLTRHVAALWHEGGSPASRLGGLTRLIRVCRHIAESGHGHLQIPGTNSRAARRVLGAGKERADASSALTVEEFIPLATAAARALAEKFDARNGHTKASEAIESALADELETFPLDLGGAEFPQDAVREREFFVSGSPAESADFRQWLELAHEIQYMNNVTDDGRCLANAYERAPEGWDKAEMLFLRVCDPDTEPFMPIFELYLEALREYGMDEYVDALTRYGWTVCRREQPSDAPPREAYPPIDLLAELRRASHPGWRGQLAHLLLRRVAAETSAMFERWEADGGPAVEAEKSAWDAEGMRHIERVLHTSERASMSEADDMHDELCRMIDSGTMPSWPFLMAYGILAARSTGSRVVELEILRRGVNYLTSVPPYLDCIVRLLEHQRTFAHKHGAWASELGAAWGVTMMSMHAGVGHDGSWDRIIAEGAESVLHPYLATRLYRDAATSAGARGDTARQRTLLQRGLMIAQNTRHMRTLMTDSEKNYGSSVTLLEELSALEWQHGNVVDSYAHAREALRVLENSKSEHRRTQRLAEIYRTLAFMIATTTVGDIFEANEFITKAKDLHNEAYAEESADARTFVMADLHLTETLIATILDNPDDAATAGAETLRLLDSLGPDWNAETTALYARLAQTLGSSHPRLTQHAMRVLRERGVG